MSKCSCGRTFQGAGSRCPQCRRDERWEDTFANTDWEGEEDEKPEVLSDGGAIDNDFDENERSTRERLLEATDGIQTEPMAGGVAIDLVTRQPLFVRRVVADSVVEYYEEEGFDLLSYKTHPYLPVRLDDTVYQCVYITGNPEQAHNAGNTYDFPQGRLMVVPVQEAWADEAGDAK